MQLQCHRYSYSYRYRSNYRYSYCYPNYRYPKQNIFHPLYHVMYCLQCNEMAILLA